MTEYDYLLNELRTDFIANEVINKNYGKSIDEIYFLIQYEYEKYTSFYTLPGSKILLYSSVKERHARNNYYSTFDDAPIYKGSIYINYQALLIDLEDKSKYLLKKPLLFELGSYIPNDIVELDELCKSHEYELPLMRVKKKLH